MILQYILYGIVSEQDQKVYMLLQVQVNPCNACLFGILLYIKNNQTVYNKYDLQIVFHMTHYYIFVKNILHDKWKIKQKFLSILLQDMPKLCVHILIDGYLISECYEFELSPL